MTEAEWLAATDIGDMLDAVRGRASERKLRLFCCACLLDIWPLLEAPLRRAVELSERFADGEATPPDVNTLANRLDEQFEEAAADSNFGNEFARMRAGLLRLRLAAVTDALSIPVRPEGVSGKVGELAIAAAMHGHFRQDHDRRHGRLLADILGPVPFRPVAAEPGWRTSAVVDLAAGIYAGRAWDRLPILADALEDAGCTDADVIGHCRGPGPHARGCWVVDLILGKG